jgi:hypothetical protein
MTVLKIKMNGNNVQLFALHLSYLNYQRGNVAMAAAEEEILNNCESESALNGFGHKIYSQCIYS